MRRGLSSLAASSRPAAGRSYRIAAAGVPQCWPSCCNEEIVDAERAAAERTCHGHALIAVPEIRAHRLLIGALIEFDGAAFSESNASWPKNASTAASPTFLQPMWSAIRLSSRLMHESMSGPPLWPPGRYLIRRCPPADTRRGRGPRPGQGGWGWAVGW